MCLDLLRTPRRALLPLALAGLLGLLAGGAQAEGRLSESSVTRVGKTGERQPIPPSSESGAEQRPRETDGPPATRPQDPASCAVAYHASLKRIEANEFSKLESVRTLASHGDPRLPGMMLIPARPATRSRAEMAALSAANAFATSKGRQAGAADADSRWLSSRLRVDLSDYLGQGPSPFLCGGVPAYVETLRRFADRIGTSPERSATLRETQVAATRKSFALALAAMQPVTPPRFAPADRPNPVAEEMLTGGIQGLRPAAGLSRSDTVTSAGNGPAAVGSDPDLPPLKPAVPIPFTTISDLTSAIDLLLSNARDGGFVTTAANQMSIGNHAGLSPPGFPVLSRIAKAREYVQGPRPLVGDRTVAASLAAALSDIEALDYLIRAEAQPGDPTGTAIHATLDAILKAHAKDCGCR